MMYTTFELSISPTVFFLQYKDEILNPPPLNQQKVCVFRQKLVYSPIFHNKKIGIHYTNFDINPSTKKL